jgi:hypothetical protein
MVDRKLYLTAIYALDAKRYPKGPYSGRGWVAVLRRPETDSSAMQGNQVGILARSQLAAQKALNMIWSAYGLLDTGPTSCEPWPEVVSANNCRSRTPEPANVRVFRRRKVAIDHVPLACMVAARASQRSDFAYALAKYALSTSIHANHIMELDPTYSDNLPLSPFREDHVRFAYAIVVSYAVIEQLGLEVRASSERPSMINGAWNPDVKSNLEDRLRRRGIDLTKQINWHVRGSVRRIERDRRPRSQGKAGWARYNVRDCYVEVIDAINDLSWLRSKVAAHKVRELAAVLSPYDVANGQQLARRLLLESLGFWRYWGKWECDAAD